MSRTVSVKITADFRRLRRACERAHDALRLNSDATARELRREWDPDWAPLFLTDEERERIAVRAMGRTLEEIDELEEAG